VNTLSFGLTRLLFLLLVALTGFGPAQAGTPGLTPNDEKQILHVVRSQLDAFAQDDATRAFSYAAPNIRHIMGTAEHFMEMVRRQYEVVYRPASAIFLRPNGDGSEAVLKLQLTDADGDPWIAVYTLQKQKNKSWRITGCAVSPANEVMV